MKPKISGIIYIIIFLLAGISPRRGGGRHFLHPELAGDHDQRQDVEGKRLPAARGR